jgi:redox-sensitive bicupin YhaK (pirin superfamily)
LIQQRNIKMSWNPALDPTIPVGDAVDQIETVIVPRARDLGGFEVRRALPSVARQMVGPFIFFDQMGPAEFLTGQGIDVRPHPHIGLATVTYLLRGRIHHRDSLGTDQWIEPGAVNWMLAGQGITHSERMDGEMLAKPHSWIALPKDREDDPAAFVHSAQTTLPILEGEGKSVRLILGNVWGETAPIETPSEMFYADATLEAGASIPLPDNHEDRGVYILAGDLTVGGETYPVGRIMLLGGATMDGPRHIWWNFVASSQDRINAAKEAWRAGDWAHGRFRLPPTDDKEFIPAPEQ